MEDMQHDPKPWTVERSQYVYNRSPYMILREDTVRLPNGARIPDYFVFEYPDWVSVLAITKAGELVLIRQYRHGIGHVHFELPAGVVDPNEPLLDSAQRELLEETGYGGGEWKLLLKSCANPGTHNNWCHIFLAVGVEPLEVQKLDHTEEISVHLMERAAALEMLRSGGVAQALHTAALWRYFADQI
ncbi:MAG: NUDIX hydrolase [Bacteroidetes bacterium]|nr:MAG: NUDIX hydrolase [Bacteroidota bacterium]